MNLERTEHYYVPDLKPEQYGQISSEEKIHKAMTQKNCMGFEAFEDGQRVGFALLREYEPGCFFLWDFIIDRRHQSKGKGRAFLSLLLEHIKGDYAATMITTTYKAGNEAARKLYEAMGFEQTDICKDRGIHEVNMRRVL